jgi:pimeloyl-ACP methyl ester carboxylesterase
MDGSGHLLRSQLPQLAKAFEVRCLRIPPDDLRGWDALADETLELVEEVRSQRPLYLFGESFGGCLALHTVTRNPDCCDRLILSNPASAFKRRPFLSWGSHLVQWMPDFLNAVSALGLLPFLAALERIPRDNRQALLDAMRHVSPKAVTWRVGLLRDFALSPEAVAQVRQPTLLIASALDRLLPSITEAQDLVNVLPNAQIRVLPHSGHACLLEPQVNLYQILHESGFVPEQAAIAQ